MKRTEQLRQQKQQGRVFYVIITRDANKNHVILVPGRIDVNQPSNVNANPEKVRDNPYSTTKMCTVCVILFPM